MAITRTGHKEIMNNPRFLKLPKNYWDKKGRCKKVYRCDSVKPTKPNEQQSFHHEQGKEFFPLEVKRFLQQNYILKKKVSQKF